MATETTASTASACVGPNGSAIGMPQLCGDWVWNQVFWLVLALVAIYFVLTRVALPALRASRGTVVLVNSGAGLFAHPQWSAYAASKHCLRAFADSLRGEEAGHGVRVSSVYPGRTATPMQEKVHAQEGKAYDAADWVQPSTVVQAILHVLELPGDATIPDLTVKPR